ncbi:MAG: translation initiation factor IF-2 [Candidatus Diapherotrites archaeon]|uniref:Probable translation initiation factor IF-2 n=1 Tax=Candidatus Iainarchaeum sp. TaxID=3101447 RepID=A0A8T4C9P7_9ARCH|nr:translation initiation factor IF-2 [Candidatus Diapherotrites archaeon]
MTTTLHQLRTPIVAVLGHVDAGKTSFLDNVRSTNVAAKEAGFITQHIGATEVPVQTIKDIAGPLVQKFGFKLSIPGLLFIDTPGHEAFTNLRERGSSIADLAVLMVDAQKGLQAQTKEAITILRNYKVPFLVCINKIDLIDGYETKPGSFLANVNTQPTYVQQKLDERVYTILGELHELGFQSERFDRVHDTTKEIALIPVCVSTGEGIPETLVFLAGLAQKFLEQNLKLEADGPGKGTCLEVRDEKGLGTTLDVILYDGKLSVGDVFVVAGKNGVIESKIRALLRPNILTDIRVAEKFVSVKDAYAATGVKISAPNLNDALAGSPFLVVKNGNEKEIIEKEVKRIKIESDNVGIILKTDTLGSLEALVKLIHSHHIKVKRADVGEITRRDVLEAAAIRAKDPYLGVIFAFNTLIQDAARKDAQLAQIPIFESNIVYSITEEYVKWVQQQEAEKNKRLLEQAIFPAKIQFLPGFAFRNSKPAVVGVRVVEGRLKNGVELMNSTGELVGRVQAIQSENESVTIAEKNAEVAVSISDAVVGRNLFENDVLYTVLTPNMLVTLKKINAQLSEDEKDLLVFVTQLNSRSSTNNVEREE